MSSNDNQRPPSQHRRKRFFWIPFGDGVPTESATTNTPSPTSRPRAEIVAPNLPGLMPVLSEPSPAVKQAMSELEYRRQQASPLPATSEEESASEQPTPPPTANAEPDTEEPTPPPIEKKEPLPVKPMRVKRTVDFPEESGGDVGGS